MVVENLQTLKNDHIVSEYIMDGFAQELNDSVPQVWPGSRRKLEISFKKYLAVLIIVAVDYNAVLLSIISVFWTRTLVASQSFSQELFLGLTYQICFLLIPFFFIGLICYERLYRRRLPFWESSAKLLKVCTFATLITIGSLFLTGFSHFSSRLFIGLIWFYSSFYLMGSRYLIQRFLANIGLWCQTVVIIGNHTGVETLKKSFAAEPGLGYQIVDVIEYVPGGKVRKKQSPLFKFEAWKKTIIQSGVSEVIIAFPELKRTELLQLIYWLQPMVKNITIMPDLQGLPLSDLETDLFFDQKAVMMRVRNNLLFYRNRLFKRIFDLCCGALFFVIASPVMLLIAVLIKFNSPGPIFHMGERLGKAGRNFKCYKFRTMYLNEQDILQKFMQNHPEAAEEWRQFAKLRAFDPRVTGVGKWLRKFSLDELPQIVNVLKGDMSLVGPRPYLPSEQERMRYYKKTILETVPGITGLWQVRGRNEIAFEGRLSLESWYVRNWSIWLDITLLIRTVGVVLRRRGAY
ncbi:MAG TPA: undecaprenyl-phosphate galactose phosphotransferase WbaP [Firmicutes bacterium]|nr:undecaprenyl-phosphate galactose phosphotransferase WbaP [Bacillota bacterium]